MKKIVAFMLVACCLMISGCKTTSFFVIDSNRNENSQTRAFNDETYIWESWQYSTNQVNEVR